MTLNLFVYLKQESCKYLKIESRLIEGFFFCFSREVSDLLPTDLWKLNKNTMIHSVGLKAIYSFVI